jgi:hypothetical protein
MPTKRTTLLRGPAQYSASWMRTSMTRMAGSSGPSHQAFRIGFQSSLIIARSSRLVAVPLTDT